MCRSLSSFTLMFIGALKEHIYKEALEIKKNKLIVMRTIICKMNIKQT